MPRYRYQCKECEDILMVFHLMSETYTDCDKCNSTNTMTKLLTTPLKSQKIKEARSDIGDITKEYIIANKEILEEEQNKAKKEIYEPS